MDYTITQEECEAAARTMLHASKSQERQEAVKELLTLGSLMVPRVDLEAILLNEHTPDVESARRTWNGFWCERLEPLLNPSS